METTTVDGHLVPEDLYRLISEAYRALCDLCGQEDVSVAVRSSRFG